jgi:ParB/RepB/Spo0J family partition protein
MPQLLTKPLSWFKTNLQVRKTFIEAELRQLGESLKVKQLQPLLCQPDGTVIAGERRLRAARLVGLEHLEVKIADEQLDQTQITLWQIQENKLREDLKPIEEVDGIAEIAQLNPQWTGAELAERLKMASGQISKCLSIKACPIAYAALADGRLKGISDAYAVAKAATPEQKEGLIALRLSGAKSHDLARAARKPRQAAPAEKVARIAVSLPGGVTIVLAGKDIDLDAAIEHLSECLKAAKKARDEGLTIKSFAASMKDKSQKAG